MHSLGPLNAPIKSEAIIEVSESDFDLETSKTASDGIGAFIGPDVCAQRFSHVSASPLCLSLQLTLVCEQENLWYQSRPSIGFCSYL